MGGDISKITTKINSFLGKAAGILGVGEKLLESLAEFFLTFTKALVDISDTLLPDLLDMAVVGTKLSLRVIEMLEKMFTNSLKFAERLEAHSSEIVDVGLHTLMTYAGDQNYNEIYILAIVEFLNHELDAVLNKVIVNLFRNDNTVDLIIEIKDISVIYWGSAIIANKLGLKIGKNFLVKLIIEVLLRRIFVFGKRTIPKRRKIINTRIVAANKLVNEIKELLNNKIKTRDQFIILDGSFKKLKNLVEYHSKNMTIEVNKEFAKIKVAYEKAKSLFGEKVSTKLSEAIELFYVKQRNIRIAMNNFSRFKTKDLPAKIEKIFGEMTQIMEDTYENGSLPNKLLEDWGVIKKEYENYKKSFEFSGTNQQLFDIVKKSIDDGINTQKQFDDMIVLFMMLRERMLSEPDPKLNFEYVDLRGLVKPLRKKWEVIPGPS